MGARTPGSHERAVREIVLPGRLKLKSLLEQALAICDAVTQVHKTTAIPSKSWT